MSLETWMFGNIISLSASKIVQYVFYSEYERYLLFSGKKTVSNLHKRKNPFGSNHRVKKQKSSNVVTQAQAKNDATKSSESSLTLFTALEKPIVRM